MFRELIRRIFMVILSLAPTLSHSVTVVECRDKTGNISYRDHCPPDSTKTATKRLSHGPVNHNPTADDIAKEHPVTLFSVKNCDACDLVRQLFSGRGVPFSEKNVDDDATTQAELKAVAGALTVPTVTIGLQVYTGYSRSALEGGLAQAGYPVPAPPTASPVATSK
ncbi:MAG: glutaredoxin family protein [Gammaproteobacteria bacterium]|nr:glutaredoxin family protein [Gammaproteobacteria bacterium]